MYSDPMRAGPRTRTCAASGEVCVPACASRPPRGPPMSVCGRQHAITFLNIAFHEEAPILKQLYDMKFKSSVINFVRS